MRRGCKPGRDPGHHFPCDRNALNRRRPCRSSSNALHNYSSHIERCAVREIQLAECQRLARVPSFGRQLMSAPFAPGDSPERNHQPILTRVSRRHQRHCGRVREGATAADLAAPMTSASTCRRSRWRRSGTELPWRAAKGLGARRAASRRGPKPSCISTPIAFSHSMSRRLTLLEPCRISRAARLGSGRLGSGVRRHRAGRDGSLPPVANCDTQHAAFGTAVRADGQPVRPPAVGVRPLR